MGETFNILEHLKELKFKKKTIFLSNVQCYSIFTSSTLYFITDIPIIMKEFPFPSLSLLKKITEGQLDAVRYFKSLKTQEVISEDVVPMFDERYLQNHEEYSGGENFGANENNELYKGLLSLMIVGLK